MDDKIEVDIEKLSLGDLEDVESVIGSAAMLLLMKGEVTPKAIVALVWVVKRADQPGYSLDDARKLPLSIFSIDSSDQTDPFAAGGTSSPSPSSASPPD